MASLMSIGFTTKKIKDISKISG